MRTKVRTVRARGGTNGMVFTNANKHSYQLQNDSPSAGAQSAYRPYKTTVVVVVVATSVPPSPARIALPILNFWSPAFPSNLEENRLENGRPFFFPISVRLRKYLTFKIHWEKERFYDLRTVSLTSIRSNYIKNVTIRTWITKSKLKHSSLFV